MSLIYAIPLLIIFHCHLAAEILTVDIKWTAALCNTACKKNVDTRLKAIPGVEKVELSDNGGMATLKWKKTAPYSAPPIRRSMQMVGLYISDMHIKLRGKILQKKDGFYIVSTGDGTQFRLLSPVTATSNQYSVQYNTSSRVLSKETEDQLKLFIKDNAILELEGQVFQSERSPPDPNKVIMNQYKLVDEKGDVKK